MLVVAAVVADLREPSELVARMALEEMAAPVVVAEPQAVGPQLLETGEMVPPVALVVTAALPFRVPLLAMAVMAAMAVTAAPRQQERPAPGELAGRAAMLAV